MIGKNSKLLSQVFFHVLEIFLSRHLVLSVSDKFIQFEFTGLLEIVLENQISLGDTLAQEKRFFLLLALKLFLIKLRKWVFVWYGLLDVTFTKLSSCLNLFFADLPTDKLGHSRLRNFLFKLYFFLNKNKITLVASIH